MGTASVDIFNQLINQYTGCITNLQSGSIAIGLEIFNSIALMSVALLGLNHLLRRNVDMVEANLELINWLMYLIFFDISTIFLPNSTVLPGKAMAAFTDAAESKPIDNLPVKKLTA